MTRDNRYSDPINAIRSEIRDKTESLTIPEGKTRFEHDRDITSRIMAQYPKFRTKEVFCPFTGEKSDSAFPYHPRVYDLIRKGLQLEAARQASQDKNKYVFPEGMGYVPYGSRSGPSIHITSLILDAFGVPVDKLERWWSTEKYRAGEYGIPLVEEPPTGKPSRPGLCTAWLTEKQAEAIVTLVEATKRSRNELARRAGDRGSRLLIGLRDGTLSIEEFNDKTARGED